jgi:hypothetical protein
MTFHDQLLVSIIINNMVTIVEPENELNIPGSCYAGFKVIRFLAGIS